MSFLGALRKQRPKRTVNFITLWDEILSARIDKNQSLKGVVRSHNLYADNNGLYSEENNVTFLYSIDAYPPRLEIDFRSVLRDQCDENARISFISVFDKHRIDWKSTAVRARLNTWKVIDSDVDDKMIDEYNMYSNISDVDDVSRRRNSLIYLSNASIRRKRKLFLCRSIMLVSGVRGKKFDEANDAILTACHDMGLTVRRITGDIPDYLKTFSPFSNMYDQDIYNKTGSLVLTDELLARMNTYAQGVVGRLGVYFGTDIFSCFPCFKPMKRTSETAEMILIIGEAGSGKSYFTKSIVAQMLADSRYNGTINDVEGDEYLGFIDMLGGYDACVVLNMAEGSGKYYDPVPIIMTGRKSLDEGMYALSTSFTLTMFKCLVGRAVEDLWVDSVLNDAISMVYNKAGVDASNMDTWHRANECTIYDVYNNIKDLKSATGASILGSDTSGSSLYNVYRGEDVTQKDDVRRMLSSNQEYQAAIDKCISQLSKYFEPTGIKSKIFKERISTDEIKDSKLVICSFGMKGRSEETVDSVQMKLMQLYAANISHLRSVFSAACGKFNFKVWEEFQRWGRFPGAESTINVALSGGRKLGDVNIVITNKALDLLNADSFGVFSACTSFAIGAIPDAKAREELCRRLSIPEMVTELDSIDSNNKDLDAYVDGDTDLTNPYKKSFLLGLDGTAYTIARMSLPYELSNSPLFKTGVKEGGFS